MENVGFKGLLVTLWQRVILSYKTTLIGIAIVALGYVIEAVTGSSTPWIHQVGIVLGTIFALVKQRLPQPPPLDAPPAPAPTPNPA